MNHSNSSDSRRGFLKKCVASSGLALMAREAAAQEFAPGQPMRYPDSRIVALEKRFAKYKLGNTTIQRIYHDPTMLWAEGCAWNAVGKYLLWSDIPNDRQMRWIED